MTEKVLLGEGELKGGLKEGTQRYKINYMPEVRENGELIYDDKIEFVILTPGKEPDKVFYHSLRFVSADQLKIVIFKLIKAYAYKLGKEKKLNVHTAKSIPHLFSKQVEQDITKLTNQTLKGVI